jgi:signal transduction histidine kinase
MSQAAYALVGLTALVAALVTLLVFAFLRFGAAVRDMKRQVHEGSAERAFVAGALQEAIGKLREQGREMTARAESSERLNSEIVSSLTSGLLVVGLRGEVRMLNPAGRRLLRLEQDGGAGHFRALLREAAPVADVVEECLSTAQAVVRRSLTVRRRDHAHMHVGVTVSPLFDDKGALQGAVCLFSDLTAVVELEEQVRLKDSLARLGELTAGLAHEFRNGLATVHGYARLLDPAQMSAEYGAYVQGIREETDTLGRVVNNFLNFARPVQLTLAPLRPEPLLRQACAEFEAEVKARGGQLTVSGDFATIEGDEVLLRQAVSNLLRNALEACAGLDSGPRIDVESRVDAGGRQLRISVADNGRGIAPAAREKLFRPFFTTKDQGTGLGLALVQKIAVSHNGRVQASDREGGGAIFTLTLPLAGQ